MTKHTGFTLQWVRDAHSFGEKIMVNFLKEFFREGKRFAIISEPRITTPMGNNNK